MEHRVLTAVGPDRPGIVSSLSAAILGAGGNLEDSRMAILGGEFALIVLLAAPAARAQDIEAAARASGEQLGLTVSLRPTRGVTAPRDFLSYRLRVSGVDQPGIVQLVTGVLAARHINVASLDTRLVNAPLSGTPTFVLDALVQIPPSASLPELRRSLTDVCEAENLDVSLDPAL